MGSADMDLESGLSILPADVHDSNIVQAAVQGDVGQVRTARLVSQRFCEPASSMVKTLSCDSQCGVTAHAWKSFSNADGLRIKHSDQDDAVIDASGSSSIGPSQQDDVSEETGCRDYMHQKQQVRQQEGQQKPEEEEQKQPCQMGSNNRPCDDQVEDDWEDDGSGSSQAQQDQASSEHDDSSQRNLSFVARMLARAPKDRIKRVYIASKGKEAALWSAAAAAAISSAGSTKQLKVVYFDAPITPADTDLMIRSLRQLEDFTVLVDGSSIAADSYWAPAGSDSLKRFKMESSCYKPIRMDMAGIGQSKGLEALELQGCTHSNWQALSSLRELQRLAYYDKHMSWYTESVRIADPAQLQVLSQLPSLREVSSGWVITPKGWCVLAGMTELHTLQAHALEFLTSSPCSSSITRLLMMEPPCLWDGSLQDDDNDAEYSYEDCIYGAIGWLTDRLPELLHCDTSIMYNTTADCLHMARTLQAHGKLRSLILRNGARIYPRIKAWPSILQSMAYLEELELRCTFCANCEDDIDFTLKAAAACSKLRRLVVVGFNCKNGTNTGTGVLELASGPCKDTLQHVSLLGESTCSFMAPSSAAPLLRLPGLLSADLQLFWEGPLLAQGLSKARHAGMLFGQLAQWLEGQGLRVQADGDPVIQADTGEWDEPLVVTEMRFSVNKVQLRCEVMTGPLRWEGGRQVWL